MFRGCADGLRRMVSDKTFARKVAQKYLREKNDDVLEGPYQYGLDYIVRLLIPPERELSRS
ncbi:MAG: hypothetical protein HY695_32990 [Deltaproteobacteria bacterium]|nr:hypothetical protein [Deltaproteobacteria bacterium]